eukprot:3156556-Ditylum_brightwellii.AAC.1
MATSMQGIYSACKTAADNIAPLQHKCIGSMMLVRKVVGEIWEEQWCSKKASHGVLLAAQMSAL